MIIAAPETEVAPIRFADPLTEAIKLPGEVVEDDPERETPDSPELDITPELLEEEAPVRVREEVPEGVTIPAEPIELIPEIVTPTFEIPVAVAVPGEEADAPPDNVTDPFALSVRVPGLVVTEAPETADKL